ncbi:MAG: gliding motility-associated C-terminal domain-containing protein [Chitinophagaceae bacterium]
MLTTHCKRNAKAMICFLLIVLSNTCLQAQTFSPIAVTGFNQDAIAEAGPNSFATTSSAVDGNSSNKIIYTNAFKTFAGLGGGGLPDNGTIVNGTSTYQLANYAGNNSLFVLRGQTGNLVLTTPASYAKIRVLCLSTEGTSLVTAALTFTDGSSPSYLTNYSLPDWFNNTANLVLSGMGRCDRATAAPYNADGYTTNPRMYYIELTLSCTDKLKLLQKITFNNVTTAGNNAPYPNAIFFAVSGATYAQTVASTITPSDCSGTNGSAALTVSGSSGPYTYAWNTTPVQTTATATGLAPGSYTCTVKDAAGCTTPYPVTITLNNNATMTATAVNPAICTGGSTQLNANSSATGNLTDFTWTPGNLTGQSITVSPTATTTYTVSGTNAIGCTATADVTVTINTTPAPPAIPAAQICNGGDVVFQIPNPQTGVTYNWYTTATGGTPVFTGTQFTVSNVTADATYYIEAVSAAGCGSTTRTVAAISLLLPLPFPVVTVDHVTFNSVTFKWDPVPGATAYEVTTNGGVSYQPPSSGPTGTTHTIGGLQPNQTVSIQVRALLSQPCQTSLLSPSVSGTTFANNDVFVPNVFTPNNDGKNDVLYVYSNAIVSMQFLIFNQWGERIFISSAVSQGWDGSYKGRQQPMGVYAYVLKATLQNGSVVTKKGSINIIR